jgi:putative ABC transport system permease protein
LVSLRHLCRAPGQTLRAVAAVAVGVGAVTAVQAVDRSITDRFAETVEAAAGGTALEVSGGETTLPEDLLDVVRQVAGVDAAVPVVESSARFVGHAGEVLTVMGVDIVEEGRVRRYTSASAPDEVLEDPLAFLNQPDSIILTRPFAVRHRLKIDDRIELLTPQGRKSFTIRGLLAPEGPAIAFGGNLAVMDYQAAQIAFAKPRRLDAIDVVVAPGTDVEALADALRVAVGPGPSVRPPALRIAEIDVATRSMRTVISLFAWLTVIVGMFLLYNAVSMTVSSRGREIALLRVVGVRRREIVELVLLETAVVGAVGAIAGVAFGRLLGSALLGPMTAAIATVSYEAAAPHRLAMRWTALLPAIALGIAVTLVAAWWPDGGDTRAAHAVGLVGRCRRCARRPARDPSRGRPLGIARPASRSSAHRRFHAARSSRVAAERPGT